MRYLHHPFSGKIQRPFWSFFGLLHEPVQDDNAAAHPPTKEGATDAFYALDPDSEQPVSHRSGMWHAKHRTMRLHPKSQGPVPSPQSDRPHIDLGPDGFGEIFEGVFHQEKYTMLVIKGQCLGVRQISGMALALNFRGRPMKTFMTEKNLRIQGLGIHREISEG